MLTPFQRLLQYSIHGANSRNILLAASGPCLRVFDSQTGQYISKWSHLPDQSTGLQDEELLEASPAKRRKHDTGNTSDTPSAEIVIENGSGRRRPVRHGFTIPCITHLLGTTDGKHVVIVTGEDKSIRVLSMSEQGILNQFSQRVLSKRPSALAFTSDENTILCADKFGDVYSLPLLGKTFEVEAEPGSQNDEESEMFKPSASSKTVHTRRNLRALESQQKQKKVKKKQKQIPQFDHDLLLGHVSLLTDIVSVSLKIDEANNRSYILTSDRDEHIRVSRGIPQAYIIENFCLGHEKFISKMHIPSWQPDTLMSAGGDDYLLIWSWREGSVRQKMNLKSHFLSHRPNSPTRPSQIAVSGIWSIETNSGEGQVLVACEADCVLLIFGLSSNGILDSMPGFQITLPHNILDVAVLSHEQSVIISLDNVHQPWTTHETAVEKTSPHIVKLKWNSTNNGKWSRIEHSSIQEINKFAEETIDPLTETLDASTLGDAFYNVEHLRKRGNTDGIEEEP